MLLVGCAPEEDVRLLLPERDASVKTLIVAYEEEGSLRVEAHALEGRGIVLMRSGVFERVTVLYYEESLEELGVGEGLVRPAPDGACNPALLPRTFTIALTQAPDDAEYVEVPSLDEPLASFRYEGPCPCVDFEAAARIPIEEMSVTGVVSGEASALVVSPHRVYRVLEDGAVDQMEVPDDTLSAAYRGPDGRTWLGTSDGRLLTGSFDGGFAETATGAPERVLAIDGSRDGAAFELFTLHGDGEIRRLDETGLWEVVYGGSEGNTDQYPDLVWAGPGKVVALEESGPGPIYYDRARLRTVEVEEWNMLSGPPAALGVTDDLTLYLANRAYQLYRFGAVGAWTLVENEDPDFFGTIRDMLPFRGGLLLSGQSGRIAQYHPDVGFCSDANLEDNIGLKYVGLAGARIITAGDRATDNAILLLDPMPR